MEVRNRRKQIRRGNSARGSCGSQAFSRTRVHRGGRPYRRTICAFVYSVRTVQLTPNPPDGNVEVWVYWRQHETCGKDAKRPTYYDVEEKEKGQQVWVPYVSCRSRAASLIPNYIRVKSDDEMLLQLRGYTCSLVGRSCACEHDFRGIKSQHRHFLYSRIIVPREKLECSWARTAHTVVRGKTRAP